MELNMNNRAFPLSLVIAAVLCGCAAADDHSTDAATEKLQGRWEIVAGVNQGRSLTPSDLRGSFVTVKINTIVTYDRDERETYRAVYRVDESKDPMHITMTTVPKNPPANELKTKDQYDNAIASGILKFDGESKWTLCYALPGAERPSKFESLPGSKVMMFTLRKKLGDVNSESITVDPTK